ncbi:helix-turn-helix transcriptional regulator [Microbacterium sp. GXF7504]
MTTAPASRTGDALTALARAGLGFEDYVTEVSDVLARAVPFDAICVGTVDPATSLLTRSHKIGLDGVGDRTFLFWEYAQTDYAHFLELSTRTVGVSILEEETDGDKNASGRFREVVATEIGAEHELRGVARTGGALWGTYALYREGGPGFNHAEVEFLHRLEGTIAAGLRASTVVAVAAGGLQDAVGPAVLIFHGGDLVHATAAAEDRLADLAPARPAELPIPVTALVDSLVGGRRLGAARISARGRSGRWYTLHAAPFADGDATQIAVTIEPASPPQIMGLLVAAYGLTEREATVVQAMLRGESTAEIARSLHLSPYTVQDHFKSIFEKTGASSRREVATRVFYGQYLGTEVASL